jgi:hypothetical protein
LVRIVEGGVPDETREVLSLVRNQVIEAAAEAWDGNVVVIHHGVAERDRQQELCEFGKVEAARVMVSAQRSLDSKPSNHDRREGGVHLLANPGELTAMRV